MASRAKNVVFEVWFWRHWEQLNKYYLNIVIIAKTLLYSQRETIVITVANIFKLHVTKIQ